MHQSWAQSDSPQRSGADFVPTTLKILLRQVPRHFSKDLVTIVLAGGLQDSVARAHVVHQEIAVRIKGHGAEGRWNREGAAVDLGSRGSGGHCLDVTRCTTDLLKQSEAFLRSRAAGELCIAGGSFRGANEAGEAINVGEAVGSGLVIWLRSTVAKIGDL